MWKAENLQETENIIGKDSSTSEELGSLKSLEQELHEIRMQKKVLSDLLYFLHERPDERVKFKEESAEGKRKQKIGGGNEVDESKGEYLVNDGCHGKDDTVEDVDGSVLEDCGVAPDIGKVGLLFRKT
ncbi:hypothetical protein HDU76_012499 [Blyttiomyces sp. JEL0837]|nr:hypothetical protein HDU76_012499 [Blyttiomyces sp. JEL0837]